MAAVAYSLFDLVFKNLLPDCSSHPLELAILFHAGLCLGLFLDYISNFLPPVLTLSFSASMFRNPGSVVLLIVLFLVFFAICALFIFKHRQQHTLLPLLIGYSIITPCYFVLGALLDLSSHIHHHMTALYLLPVVNVKCRTALF